VEFILLILDIFCDIFIRILTSNTILSFAILVFDNSSTSLFILLQITLQSFLITFCFWFSGIFFRIFHVNFLFKKNLVFHIFFWFFDHFLSFYWILLVYVPGIACLGKLHFPICQLQQRHYICPTDDLDQPFVRSGWRNSRISEFWWAISAIRELLLLLLLNHWANLFGLCEFLIYWYHSLNKISKFYLNRLIIHDITFAPIWWWDLQIWTVRRGDQHPRLQIGSSHSMEWVEAVSPAKMVHFWWYWMTFSTAGVLVLLLFSYLYPISSYCLPTSLYLFPHLSFPPYTHTTSTSFLPQP